MKNLTYQKTDFGSCDRAICMSPLQATLCVRHDTATQRRGATAQRHNDATTRRGASAVADEWGRAPVPVSAGNWEPRHFNIGGACVCLVRLPVPCCLLLTDSGAVCRRG